MTVLLVVDMQVACLAGTPPRFEADAVIGRINRLSAAVRPRGRVIFIRHTDPDEGFARNSAGWQIVPQLQVTPGDLFIEKEGCDSFLETDLDATLRRLEASTVIICGCATDFCVDTTVRTAAALGYQVWVPSDAHSTRDRPHLAAPKIIEHHNYMWADLLLPRKRKIVVEPVAEILSRLQ